MLVHSEQWGPDIRTLCTRILESTIKDLDKFQVGLSKIFFRAGLLAQFEVHRVTKLNSLAVLMQKNFRRHMGVKRFSDIRRAAIGIQTVWRATLAKRLAEATRKDAAALLIQRITRGYLERTKFLQARKAIVGLQSRSSLLSSFAFVLY